MDWITRFQQQRLPWLFLIVAQTLFAGCTAFKAGFNKPANLDPIRFLALGDSYTIGQSVQAYERWPVQLAALLRGEGYEVEDPIIVAQTGWTTGELLRGINESNLQGKFDLVSVLIGVNNQYRGLKLEEYKVEFHTLLDLAIEYADGNPNRVIVLSIPDWSVTPFAQMQDQERITNEIDKFNEVNFTAAKDVGVRYVDVTAISREAAQDLSLIASDGLHPSGKMYTRWAELVLPEAMAALGDEP